MKEDNNTEENKIPDERASVTKILMEYNKSGTPVPDFIKANIDLKELFEKEVVYIINGEHVNHNISEPLIINLVKHANIHDYKDLIDIKSTEKIYISRRDFSPMGVAVVHKKFDFVMHILSLIDKEDLKKNSDSLSMLKDIFEPVIRIDQNLSRDNYRMVTREDYFEYYKVFKESFKRYEKYYHSCFNYVHHSKPEFDMKSWHKTAKKFSFFGDIDFINNIISRKEILIDIYMDVVSQYKGQEDDCSLLSRENIVQVLNNANMPALKFLKDKGLLNKERMSLAFADYIDIKLEFVESNYEAEHNHLSMKQISKDFNGLLKFFDESNIPISNNNEFKTMMILFGSDEYKEKYLKNEDLSEVYFSVKNGRAEATKESLFDIREMVLLNDINNHLLSSSFAKKKVAKSSKFFNKDQEKMMKQCNSEKKENPTLIHFYMSAVNKLDGYVDKEKLSIVQDEQEVKALLNRAIKSLLEEDIDSKEYQVFLKEYMLTNALNNQEKIKSINDKSAELKKFKL